jgi:parallel beta-helix repeat protein
MKSPLRTLTLAICASILGASPHLKADTVTNTNDSGPGSLRSVLSSAISGATIDFDSTLNGATITLTSGELSISGLALTIDASTLPSGIKISGNANSRIFKINNSSIVTLRSLQLLNGRISNDNGGGIYASNSQLNCDNTSIRDCYSFYEGGGLWANGVTGSMDRCSFIGNDSRFFGGGIYLIGSTPWMITNSVISGNRSVIGGGIAANVSSPTIINCTIQGNSGSGIQLESASAPSLKNTIVWGNRSGDGSTISQQQIKKGTSSSANATLSHCLVEDGSLPANYPKFIDPATPSSTATPPDNDVDLRVFTNSPVLNVGDNGSNSTPLDLAGKTRIQNTTIDLGAFEGSYVTFAYLHPALGATGDENGNGASNFLEYASGIDPTAPHDPAVSPVLSISGGFHFLTSSQRINAADVAFFWETSTTMESLSWQKMTTGTDYTVESTSNPSPDRQQVVLKLLHADSRRFYRQGFSNLN